RVEVRRLARDHMLDTPVPGERSPRGQGTQPHHKRPIGWERQWELGHRRLRQPPVKRRHLHVVHGMPGAYNMLAVQDYGPSVKIGGCSPPEAFKSCKSAAAGGKVLWTRSTRSPLGLFVWR